MVSLDGIEFFDGRLLGVANLDTPMSQFVLRLLIAAARLDPRDMSDVGLYTWCIPCELCVRNVTQIPDVQRGIIAIGKACRLILARLLQEGVPQAALNAVGSTDDDIGRVMRYFDVHGFDEDAYMRDRCIGAIQRAVTHLRYQLDMPTRLMLEEKLSHRPELLRTNMLDTICLWWDKRQAMKTSNLPNSR